MRLVVLSDVHGNSIALEAVLADVEASGGADAYWVLGDLAALGYDPGGATRRQRELPGASFVRGNTDRYTTTGPIAPHAQPNAALFEWTASKLRDAGLYDFVSSLPLDVRTTTDDGTRILGVHASPGNDDGAGVHPNLTDEQLADVVAGCEADLVFVGHTHWPLDRTVGGVRVVNLGSVSNQWADDLRAKYAVVEWDKATTTVTTRRVDYDHAAVIAAVESSDYPAAGKGFLIAHQRGERTPPFPVRPS